jgi:hypothetical protein
MRRSLVDSQFSERAISDIEAACRSDPRESVWLAQSGDALLNPVRLQIDDFDRMVAGCGEKQAIARLIEGKMIKSSGNAGKRNRPVKHKGWFLLSFDSKCTQQDGRYYNRNLFHRCSRGLLRFGVRSSPFRIS